MKAAFLGLILAAVSVAPGQTLGDMGAAAGVAGTLAKGAATNGVGAAARARKALGGPFQSRGLTSDEAPVMQPGAKAGAPAATGQPAPQIQRAAPWAWRLKGYVTGKGSRVAVWEGPGGEMRYVREGDKLDLARIVGIRRNRVMVTARGGAMRFEPW